MIYVGIDVAKETHYAAVMDDNNNVLVKPFDFNNDAVGFAKLISKLSAYQKDNLLIGLESTGIYSENLIAFLYQTVQISICRMKRHTAHRCTFFQTTGSSGQCQF